MDITATVTITMTLTFAELAEYRRIVMTALHRQDIPQPLVQKIFDALK
jgi:hypothetical protein